MSCYRPTESIAQALQGLYRSYGYDRFKVGEFEEYDLYAQNRNFLTGKQILSFSDTNGRLLALKPDVTLSVIRSTRPGGPLRKVWYTESVYRVPRNAYGFREIMQTGLECIGPMDLYAMGEVLMLAARSLQELDRPYVLELSHLGLLTGVLDAAALPARTADAVLEAMGAKNVHALEALDLPDDTLALLTNLCRLSGPVESTLPRLLAMDLPPVSRQAAEELEKLCRLPACFGDYNITIDLSVISDREYYSGLVFRGFVDGVANPVLSGGRYDYLLHRMGHDGGGAGFAVYLNELERLPAEGTDYDVDVLLVYGPEDDPAQVAATARDITAAGETVRVQPAGETAVTYRRRIGPDGREINS